MKIDTLNSNEDFMAKFLAKQDLPKPAQNPISELAAKPQADSFVSSQKEAKEETAVKSDDTFVKSAAPEVKEATEEAVEEQIAEVKPEGAEAKPEVTETEEVKEEVTEEVKDEQTSENSDDNVTKKTKFIDKIKNFFKNLFIKKKDKDTKAELTTVGSSAGSTN